MGFLLHTMSKLTVKYQGFGPVTQINYSYFSFVIAIKITLLNTSGKQL